MAAATRIRWQATTVAEERTIAAEGHVAFAKATSAIVVGARKDNVSHTMAAHGSSGAAVGVLTFIPSAVLVD